jgi:hypothetical protein
MSSAVGTADNPFGGGSGGSQSTALTLSNQSQPMGGVMLELPNGSKIRVASDADAQLLKSWYQSQQQQSAQSLGGGSMSTLSEGGGTPTTRALRTAADGANALSGFFAGRDFRNKLNDYDDAQETLDRLHDEIRSRPTNDPLTNAQMMRILDAQQELFDAQAAVLETQISAVDIQTGAGVANVVASFTDSSGSRSNGGGSGAGTTIALGAAGVGAALLLSRDSRDRRRRR